MKKLSLKGERQANKSWLMQCLDNSSNIAEFISMTEEPLSKMDITFYPQIGELLSIIGFNSNVTREGDVNCRFDATIIDNRYSIPIEIKSPREDAQINIKSIRQALENKIVLLSRKFYPTEHEITSLAIAQYYPPSRSDVFELIDDIYSAWGINIGIISLSDLLTLAFKVSKDGYVLNFDYFNHLKGKLDYEKAIAKK
jgi:hypothetical protein